MAGRDPEEATANFIEPLQKAISCVTREVFSTTGYERRLEPHALTLARGQNVRLQGAARLFFRAALHFGHAQASGVLGPWKVSTAGYYYTLLTNEEELLAFHWHPTARGEINWPHLHLGPSAQVGHASLQRAHVPTGRVALEDILRLAIDELGVQPLRDDWQQVLAQAQEGFERARSW
ncbi:MAG: hypothetical protein HY534_06950 [Chloroflexi bacterium]|nr:hypothetical protein [Chloroflexota bacterium]